MVLQTLLVKARGQQFFPMFSYLRDLLCSIKDFRFAVILLSVFLILVTCKECSVNEEQNQLGIEACKSNGDSFNDSSNAVDAHVGSELVLKHSVEQHSIENICPLSDSFCFTSTLTGISVNEIDDEDASGVHPEGFSSRSKQVRSNLSRSPHQAIFNLLGGRSISCSFSMQDGFLEFPLSDRNTESNYKTDVSSCGRPLINKKTHSSRAVEDTETAKLGFLDGLSTPPVEVKPSLLDWGHKNMFHSSLAFLTLKNVHADSSLSIYDLYSSNPQFYPCNLSEVLLAPGEVLSMCFVFYPMHLGLSQAQLVLQTSFGGFLIQAKGYAVESPYHVKALNGADVTSSGRWRQNLSLFNPFDDVLYVDEVSALISTSPGNSSCSSTSLCRIHSTENFGGYSVLSSKDWVAIETGFGRPLVAMRPHNNWEVSPQKTENIMELDLSGHFQGKIVAAFCLKLLRSSNDDEPDTVIIPLEAELSLNTASYAGHVSLSLEVLVPCNASGLIAVALSIRNDAPHMLRFIKITGVGEGAENFQIKSLEGLVLFPNTTTKVAIVNYAHIETHEVSMTCKLRVLINDTRNSLIEIPCHDAINIFRGKHLESSVGNTEGTINVDYITGGERIFSSSSMQPSSGIKVVDEREADELVLINWKSQATASFVSVLYEDELLFPTVLVGNHCSQWIAVRNPSEKPVVMQIILNSGEVIDKCKKPEVFSQLSSSKILSGEKSIAPISYGFSIAKDAVTEALIHPYGSATLGPIFFQPSNRCEWRSSVLLRNNLSGVEWLSLRGFGGSISLVLLEDNPVQSLEFKLNLSTLLNFSSPDALQSVGGKLQSCHQPLTKEVDAKNMGDLPLEVIKLAVSGAECALDGFTIHDCKGFSLLPGESTRLHISYQSDFSAATIYRDLELVLASGVVVIPMKASIPLCFLNFCKRSMFWIRLKKVMLVILFAASLLVFLLFTNVPTFSSQDLKDGKSPSSVVRSLNYLYVRFNQKNNGVDGCLRPHAQDEALLLESASTCSKDVGHDEGHVNLSAGHQEQTNSPVDIEPEANSVPPALSRALSTENFDMQDAPDSRNLRVRIGKEKGRRRRKKKNSGTGVLPFEVSSSHSSNSTPSSPLSPVVPATPKRPPLVSPAVEQPMEHRNPFSVAPLQKIDKTESSKSLPQDAALDKEVISRRGNNNCGACAEENPRLAGNLAVRSMLSPSATFPSAGRALSPWACHSPYLASASAIDPHARAPGSKLHNRKTGGLEEKMAYEQKYTYDIWGDHLFGLPLTYQSNKVSGISLSASENNSESFFVRGPQALMKNSMLQPANSDLEGNE